jgi:DNA-binding MarR family transcriptional regulator
MAKDFATTLVELKVLIDHNVADFGNNYKILFLVEKLGISSPKEICAVLNMAKSNLAILASNLRLQKCLEQYKTQDNKKEILYRVTDYGKTKLNNKLQNLNIEITEKEKIIKHIKSLIEEI